MQTNHFTDNIWKRKLTEHYPIKPFLTNNSYHYIENIDSKKIINIGNNVTVIDRIPTFSKFLGFFEELTKNIYAFRGFNDFNELLPGYRRLGKEIDEIQALKLFEKQGSAYFNAKNPIEFIATAQHFGLPTRLIDFTTNPFIALFFATYKPLNNDRKYYYIACSRFETNLILEELPVFNSVDINKENVFFGLGSEDQYHSFYRKIADINEKIHTFYNDSTLSKIDFEIIKNRINQVRERNENDIPIGVSAEESRKNKSCIFIQPSFTNERIKNQQGLFMYPYDDNIETHTDILVNNLSIIAVHKSYRDDIITYLNRIGITEYKMMPDLASICYEITRELREKL